MSHQSRTQGLRAFWTAGERPESTGQKKKRLDRARSSLFFRPVIYGGHLGETTLLWVVTRMDTPKYGETLKSMYIKYQPILVVLPKVYQV